MASARGKVSIDIETCKGCELCVEACLQDSLQLSSSINKKGHHYAVLIKDNCTGCVNCALVCPDAVITVYRTKKETGKKQQVATISNVKDNINVMVSDVPEGGVSI